MCIRDSMGKITKGDITSGEYVGDQKEIYQFPVAKPPKDMNKRNLLPVDKLPKDKKLRDSLLEQRKSGAGYSGSEDYKQ